MKNTAVLPAALMLCTVLARPAAACGLMGSWWWGAMLMGMVALPVLGIGLMLFCLAQLGHSAVEARGRARVARNTQALYDQAGRRSPSERTQGRGDLWSTAGADPGLMMRAQLPWPSGGYVSEGRFAKAHVEGARCPVCGSGGGSSMVTCAACAVPHHADCFDYNGGCGIYGCAQ